MTKNLLIFIMPILVVFYPCTTGAQDFSLGDVKNQMIGDWTRAKGFTLGYIYAMPEDKYDFKPVDSVQNFAQQMIHLAVVDMFLVSIATDKEPPIHGWADFGLTPSSQTKDSVLYHVTASYDYCIDAISSLDPKRWGERKKLSGRQKTRFELVENAFEHQSHHRGQTTIYLRLQGIAPPEANLF